MKNHTYQDLLTLVNTHVSSPLKDQLVSFLEIDEIRNRLIMAPASSAVRYHHAYDGGLVDHIIDTIELSLGLHHGFQNSILLSGHDIVVVAVLHDIHKIGDTSNAACYEANLSAKTGKRSEAEPFKKSAACYTYPSILTTLCTGSVTDRQLREIHLMATEAKDYLPGGVLSLALVHAYAPELYKALTPEQVFAIRYHDGAYQSGAKFDMGGKETPLQIIFHCADMLSSRRRNSAPNA